MAVAERRPENVVRALGEEMPALVLLDVRIAALHRLEHGRHVRGYAVLDVPVVEVVRRAYEDGGDFSLSVLRVVDVGGEPRTVPHGDHDLAVDHGERLELVLQIPADG